ncbi:pyridoxamine 5'-phosphate oxidase-related FMN-binding [Desulfatibacillum aliphaticivorans]|uniref:Pyridoxamine 5'-phosphate oxidase-related FMN-binding n=1 Tax=Desulfatibacillum aliphaticivorans TaxID=218208 RepID=B8FKT2_DESAL|nr:pyridoxamine 5'-phosphate oxidase family protein [Desulfatibacillum aliphaticivorans]ACL04454.1 pyridoxamine 5'-phosphate oxidase-related FMN-binding [Desulfatibacillum aliphaticivorans]
MKKIFDLLARENMCVLATDAGGKPHCSLMAYMLDRQGNALIMVTGKNSAKHKNMQANPNVCVMVDTRASFDKDQDENIQALTVTGTYGPQDPRDLMELTRAFLILHPRLKPLLDQEDTEFFRVHINSILLLDGPVESTFIELD